KGAFVPSQTRNDEIERIKPDSAARIAADAAIECINCGICYAACDTVRWNSGYLGPAALNRAWTLVNDVRDGANAARLQAGAAPPRHLAPALPGLFPPPPQPARLDRGPQAPHHVGVPQGRDMNVRLYVWQRLTAALMVPLVLAHVAVIFYASRKGMTAADI